MKETADIVHAYQTAVKAGLKCALATVVHVEGSSYRRPGARMLVCENGLLTGAISGGCLEGDALRKALLAISEQKNKIVTYDTTDEDDAKFGVQLGCNGIVHILFEPIILGDENNPIALLTKAIDERKNAVIVTLFSLNNPKALQPGTCFFRRDEEQIINKNIIVALQTQLEQETINVLCYKQSNIKQYHLDGAEFTAFFSFIKPVIQLVIAGAGNDAMPLVNIATLMGWHTIIADGRADHATKQRFPSAQQVLVAKPHQLLEQVKADTQTVFVLMTHNYNYDIELLQLLLDVGCDYIGILGPKKKLQRMFDELNDKGIEIKQEHRDKIHSPVGLDIGAETAEEIALSITAEIKAVLSVRNGQPLKLENGPIHERASVLNLYEKRLKVS